MTTHSSQSESLLWSLTDVSLNWASGTRLTEVNLEIPAGVTAVMGYSGAGKTSLLNLLVKFERPDRGTVLRTGSADDGLDLFWVPHTLGLWPQYSVLEHLTLVCPQAELHQFSPESLLDQFNLKPLAAKYPGQLSQGEASRLAVARALASHARVIVMDEPLVHVDQAHWPAYWKVIREFCQERQISLVFSSHSPELVLREATHVVCLEQGRIVYAGDVNELYHDPPDCQIAGYLGPVNDLSKVDRQAMTDNEKSPRFTRPEQLSIVSDDQGFYEVQDVKFSGSVEEVTLIGDGNPQTSPTLFHRPARSRLRKGERVSIRLLLLFLCVLFQTGCIDDAPQLTFSETVQWPVPAEGLKVPAPRSLNVGPGDELYVLDNAGRVLVYNSDNDLVRQWEMPDFEIGKPEGICLLRNGQIAVADTHYHRVVFFDQHGKVLKYLGELGEGPGQFIYPVSVVQDPAGNIYVSEYGDNDRVQKFSEQGEFLLEFGSVGTAPGEFQRAAGIIWHDGKIYVSDAVNNRIQVFSDEGQFLEVLGTKTGGLSLYYPYDIAIDRHHNQLYIVEYGAGRITKTDLSGRVLGVYGKTGMNQGEFLTPWGLTVNSKDQVYVADTGNRLIVKLIP
ncbi:ATP-binding cassette domain-containing protein [Gimesia sp.]|uniref:ATP-binding cassette domain-containing protein n=1 Tax=Gimesia sp. TaxID=2024833 RepID=UPI003A9290D9